MKIQDSHPPDDHRSLERFRQETDYVCLKLAVKDWETFLAEVRLGNIVKQARQKEGQKAVLSERMTPVTLNPNGNINSFLNQLFESMSTRRSSTREKNFECESPICTQERILPLSSNDPLSHQSSIHSFADNSAVPTAEDPFQTYKLEHLWQQTPSMQQHTLAQIIQQIDHYSQKPQKSSAPFQGFETFRNSSCIDESPQEERQVGRENQEVSFNERTAKKGHSPGILSQQSGLETTLQKVPSEEWISKSTSLNREVSTRECMLAVENTKLRKQIRLLLRIMNRQSFVQQSQI